MNPLNNEEYIAHRYHRFGITESMIREYVQEGFSRGMTREASLIAVRMALSEAFGTEERFSLEDVAAATGSTIEEAYRTFLEHQDELMEIGGIIEPRPFKILH